jgi:hypothetical protein
MKLENSRTLVTLATGSVRVTTGEELCREFSDRLTPSRALRGDSAE